jgi:hypothetical protein
MSLDYARDHFGGAVRRHYTAPSDDRTSTTLRDLGPKEAVGAVDEIMSLLLRTAVAAAEAGEGTKLATLADLG